MHEFTGAEAARRNSGSGHEAGGPRQAWSLALGVGTTPCNPRARVEAAWTRRKAQQARPHYHPSPLTRHLCCTSHSSASSLYLCTPLEVLSRPCPKHEVIPESFSGLFFEERILTESMNSNVTRTVSSRVLQGQRGLCGKNMFFIGRGKEMTLALLRGNLAHSTRG